jgi:hypothetical protein
MGPVSNDAQRVRAAQAGEPSAPVADAEQPGRQAGGESMAALNARGRPPQPGDKVGRFSCVGRVGADTLEKLQDLPSPSAEKGATFEARLLRRLEEGYDADDKHRPHLAPLFDYYANDVSAAEINDALRSGEPDRIAQVTDDVRAMRPMLTSVPVGEQFNRVLLQDGGWGQQPLDAQGLAQLKHQLAAAEPGTVIQEHGLMSTAPGATVHGEWEGEAGVQLVLTAAEKGVRTMGIGEDGHINDCVFPPGQKMVIQSFEEREVRRETIERNGEATTHRADMLVVQAGLLASEASGGDEPDHAPSDSDSEP